MTLADTAADIEMPMERPLHAAAVKTAIASVALEAGEEDLDASALFSQFVVDKAALVQHVHRTLQQRAQVTLRELLDARPLTQGLAELVAYLQIAGDASSAVDENVEELVRWRGVDGRERRARLPRVIFSR